MTTNETSAREVVTPCHIPLFQVVLVGDGRDLDDWHVCAIVGWDHERLPVVSDLEMNGILITADQGDGRFGIYTTFERACKACESWHQEELRL